MTLSGTCDSNWVEDLNDRQSMSGYIFMINSGTISWQMKKQQTVATSTMQAEYQALSGAVKEAREVYSYQPRQQVYDWIGESPFESCMNKSY